MASTHITDEGANRLRDQWSQNALVISTTCAPLVTAIIDGMPSVVKHPQHTELHKMAERTPREAFVLLMNVHVILCNLWGEFLAALEEAGLGVVRKQYFSLGVLVVTHPDGELM